MEQVNFKNSCIKLFARLLGTAVGCIFLSVFGFTLSQSPYIRTIIQIINIIIVISVSYPVANKLGSTDCAIVNAGHRKYVPLKGLYVALVATIPMILANVILILSKLVNVFPAFYKYVYKFVNAFYYPISFSLMSTDYTLQQTPWSDILICVLTVIIIPVICAFGYWFGLNQFSFSEVVFYKKTNEGD